MKKTLSDAASSQVPDWVPRLLFMFSLIVFAVMYGMAAAQYRLFPYTLFVQSANVPESLLEQLRSLSWLNTRTTVTEKVPRKDAERMAPGLTKVVSMEGGGGLAVKIIDAEANEQQYYKVEWKDVWPEKPEYLAPHEVPQARPGTHIHGAELMPNGDVVFNFEHLSLVRMNACSEVVWRLPFRTHHSVFVDEDGFIWVSAQENRDRQHYPSLPFIKPPFVEPIILKVSPQGEIVEYKSVLELLVANGQDGALYTSSIANEVMQISGDTLHLNDVEVFPSTVAPGVFVPGDVMISLRNINAIFVFDSNWKLKYEMAFDFVRQHDPDFIDGNRIAIFDNYNIAPRDAGPQSRILMHDARTGKTEVVFSGTAEEPFFSSIMGKQQWLDNGNLLISESRYGRALELAPNGDVVWEYYNLIEQGWLGVVEEVERLPANYDAAFFAQARKACES